LRVGPPDYLQSLRWRGPTHATGISPHTWLLARRNSSEEIERLPRSGSSPDSSTRCSESARDGRSSRRLRPCRDEAGRSSSLSSSSSPPPRDAALLLPLPPLPVVAVLLAGRFPGAAAAFSRLTRGLDLPPARGEEGAAVHADAALGVAALAVARGTALGTARGDVARGDVAFGGMQAWVARCERLVVNFDKSSG